MSTIRTANKTPLSSDQVSWSRRYGPRLVVGWLAATGAATLVNGLWPHHFWVVALVAFLVGLVGSLSLGEWHERRIERHAIEDAAEFRALVRAFEEQERQNLARKMYDRRE